MLMKSTVKSLAANACLLALFLIPSFHALGGGAEAARALPPTLKPESQHRDAKTYDWDQRHAAVLKRNLTVKPDLVFLGDSITHFWGGEPSNFRGRGEDSWASMIGAHVASNLGFGFDYIDNAYYRIENGELDGISPDIIVILLGTNNLGHRKDSVEACAANMRALLQLVAEKSPKSKILLLGIPPRGDAELNQKIFETNRQYSKMAGGTKIFYADLGSVFLPAGADRVPADLMPDGVHPNVKGYQLLGAGIKGQFSKMGL
jgi:lysophospholipase L1-like esterase